MAVEDEHAADHQEAVAIFQASWKMYQKARTQFNQLGTACLVRPQSWYAIWQCLGYLSVSVERTDKRRRSPYICPARDSLKPGVGL